MQTILKQNRLRSSRRHIQIKSIHDGIVEYANHKYGLILQISSINFELKSAAEQDALIENYQSVLNSLSCPIQILVCIREIDLDKYLEEFNTRFETEESIVFKNQIDNYIEFVSSLIADNKILTRQFYIVIPQTASKQTEFETVKEQLLLNKDIISKGLERLGMKAMQLSTLELMDFYYSFYNPSQTKTQPFSNKTKQMLKEAYL